MSQEISEMDLNAFNGGLHPGLDLLSGVESCVDKPSNVNSVDEEIDKTLDERLPRSAFGGVKLKIEDENNNDPFSTLSPNSSNYNLYTETVNSFSGLPTLVDFSKDKGDYYLYNGNEELDELHYIAQRNMPGGDVSNFDFETRQQYSNIDEISFSSRNASLDAEVQLPAEESLYEVLIGSSDVSETSRTSISSGQGEDISTFNTTGSPILNIKKKCTITIDQLAPKNPTAINKSISHGHSPRVQKSRTDEKGRSLGAEYDPFEESELNRAVDIEACTETAAFETDYPMHNGVGNLGEEGDCPTEVLKVITTIHALHERQKTLLESYKMTDDDWIALAEQSKKSKRRKEGDAIKWVADYNTKPYLRGRKNKTHKYILRKHRVNSVFGVLNMRGIRAWVRCSADSDNEDDIDDMDDDDDDDE